MQTWVCIETLSGPVVLCDGMMGTIGIGLARCKNVYSGVMLKNVKRNVVFSSRLKVARGPADRQDRSRAVTYLR